MKSELEKRWRKISETEIGSVKDKWNWQLLVDKLVIKKKVQLIIRKEKGNITTDLSEVKKIIGKYHEQLRPSNLSNLTKMEKFLRSHKLPKVTQGEIENLSITFDK